MRVLLTGARAPATLELARLCARAGHIVHVADTTAWHICRGSRLIVASHVLPAPRAGHAAYAAALQALITAHRLDMVVPTCEEVFHVAAVASELSAPVRCEPRARLRRLHDKWEFIAACHEARVAAPATYLLDGGTPALAGLPKGRYILKPRFSRFATRVRTWSSGDVAPDFLDTEPGWIAQARLGGTALCTWSVAEAGEVLAHATYAVDATAGARGAAIAFHSVRHDAVLSWVRQFIAHHRLSGQFAFDFIETVDHVLPLECNPRLTSGVHCFRNLPEVADRLLGVGPRSARLEPPEGLFFRSRLAMLTYGRSAGRGAGLLDAGDDPWPRRLQLVSWAHLLARAARLRTDPRAVSTRDIEWNGE
jgi:hypothetical protein